MTSNDPFTNLLGQTVGSTFHLTATTAEAMVKAYGSFLGGVMEAWAGAMEKYCRLMAGTGELLPPAGGTESLGHREAKDWSPPVDVDETDDEYRIIMDLPNVSRSDIKVTPPSAEDKDDNQLTIRGERKRDTGKSPYRLERSSGRFMRRFNIPHHVDRTKIRAEYGNGVLCLHLPKKVKPIPITEKR